MKIAERRNVHDFIASNGWMDRFKKRNGLKFRTLHGEAAAVDENALHEWQENVLKPLLEKYPSEDVFNLDELGVFWKILPNKTYALKG